MAPGDELEEDAATTALAETLGHIEQIQHARLQTYDALDSAFAQYLVSGPEKDFAGFRQAVHESTQLFQKLSAQLTLIRDRFVTQGRSELADMVAELQALEKDKLSTTADYQLAAQEALERPADVDDPMDVGEADTLKRRIAQLTQQASDLVRSLKYEL
eukprot:m.28819 g.28819  ORF g.28819 m.28819 type:complete len:159 (-) comp8953_c1_seq1:235-711(-)